MEQNQAFLLGVLFQLVLLPSLLIENLTTFSCKIHVKGFFYYLARNIYDSQDSRRRGRLSLKPLFATSTCFTGTSTVAGWLLWRASSGTQTDNLWFWAQVSTPKLLSLDIIFSKVAGVQLHRKIKLICRSSQKSCWKFYRQSIRVFLRVPDLHTLREQNIFGFRN